MFRITEDPSSESLVQCLAKNHTLCMCVVHCIYSELHTCTIKLYRHNTDLVHVNGHDRIILVIFSQALHCKRLPDDGSSVIRNMLEHF